MMSFYLTVSNQIIPTSIPGSQGSYHSAYLNEPSISELSTDEVKDAVKGRRGEGKISLYACGKPYLSYHHLYKGLCEMIYHI